MAMIDDTLAELKSGIEKAKEALKRELGKLRTGRAHAGMVDSIRVDYYGQTTPIPQMATVSVPEPRLITIKPWDKSQTQAIEKALRESDLGLNPQTDGDLIRLPIPRSRKSAGRTWSRWPRSTGKSARSPSARCATRPSTC